MSEREKVGGKDAVAIECGVRACKVDGSGKMLFMRALRTLYSADSGLCLDVSCKTPKPSAERKSRCEAFTQAQYHQHRSHNITTHKTSTAYRTMGDNRETVAQVRLEGLHSTDSAARCL
jgi:hypothetical protein